MVFMTKIIMFVHVHVYSHLYYAVTSSPSILLQSNCIMPDLYSVPSQCIEKVLCIIKVHIHIHLATRSTYVTALIAAYAKAHKNLYL